MKKLLMLVLFACLFTQGSFAQAKPAKPKTAAVKPAAAVKKDGTADMRFKANKEAAKPVGPLKKDGTPDMRFKANKEAAKPVDPLKKDGTPDNRFKANKPAAPAKKKP